VNGYRTSFHKIHIWNALNILPKEGEEKMKKTILIATMLLASLILCTIPNLRYAAASGIEIKGTWQIKNKSWMSVEPARCEICQESDPAVVGDMQYDMDLIDAEEVSATGKGIYVAVLDTGLMYNYANYLPSAKIRADLGKGYSYHVIYWNETAQDFYLDGFYDTRGFITEFGGQPDTDFGLPYGNGHGTHVTSTVTGFTYRSSTYHQEFFLRGVAPDAQIIPVLVLDTWIGYIPPGQSYPEGYYLVSGVGSDEMVAAGIRYCGDLAKQKHIKIVISMSLGGSELAPIEKDAIDYAIKKGCIVVAAAGNAGTEGMDYPGAYSPVISVASGGWTMENIGTGSSPHSPPYRWWLSDAPENFHTTDALGNNFQLFVNDFSSRPNPDLGQHWYDLDVCAPGSWNVGPYSPYGAVLSAFGYYFVGGTSMATPHVSGIAALVLEKYPCIDQCMMEIILKTAALQNRMTTGFHDGSALVYAYQGGGVYAYQTFTWTTWDYGTGWLQADAALCVARLFFSCGKGGSDSKHC
jgi:subtilisin family serine protease